MRDSVFQNRKKHKKDKNTFSFQEEIKIKMY